MLPRVSLVKCHDADYLLFSGEDAISGVLFRTGSWESHLLMVSQMFYQGLTEPLILDVGANLGAYSIPIAKQIDAVGGKVIGFEPQRIVYYQLCGNIILNRLENYTALNKAVGDYEGEIEIPDMDYEKHKNIGAFSLNKDYSGHLGNDDAVKATGTKVPIIKLDSLSLEKAPALIKIDVEGLELNVLRGGAGLLERHSYPPILFEAWNFDWFQAARKELFDFIAYMGYEIYSISPYDHVAQHPACPVRVEFTVSESAGTVNMQRVR